MIEDQYIRKSIGGNHFMGKRPIMFILGLLFIFIVFYQNERESGLVKIGGVSSLS